MSACRALPIAVVAAVLASGRGRSPDACAPCHRAETAAFAEAAMTRALESGRNAAILRTNPKLAVSLGAYTYEIVRSGNESIYSVTDGKDTFRVPIEWAFGQGAAGQTYVFRLEGKWVESRVSYFAALRGLALTIGHEPSPHTLTEAAGRVAPLPEMRQCFDCHATNVARGKFSVEGIEEGVQCERCHGPSEGHLATMRTGASAGSAPPHLAGLSTERLSDFCGQCHRTWSQIAMNGPRGIGNVRFQPYRLTNSRCYDSADSRIKCTACHNPHRQVETAAGAYDAKCVACHSRTPPLAGKASTRLCKVATSNCVTCHMPRLELPGAHQKFTDHRIRIVRANETYPD
jgi:hypothetical protein